MANISKKSWLRYIERLRKLNDKASDSVKQYITDNGGLADIDRQKLIEYAYGVATKYGEGAASLSAEMYEAMAMRSGKRVKAAITADTPTVKEVATTVNGILKRSHNEDMLSAGVGRLVKRTGVDTVMNNALRDGAEWAWIPHGDTCAFCLTLASQGWVKASKKALKNGHAEHIHANCDCTYAVRFDHDLQVEGYDPEVYKDIYDNAEGRTPDDKINSIRRMRYAEHKDMINAQKRAAYAERNAEQKNQSLLKSSDTRGIMNIASGGQRNELPLTHQQLKECKDYATSLGMPIERIAYSENYYTGYSPGYDILLIGTDVYPNVNSNSINGRLSYRCAIAHEIVGHREAGLRGLTYFRKGDPLDEAQASIRAARFAPGLTQKERNMLIMDGIERLYKNGIRVRDVKLILDIYER